jgi:hypothetical protein
MEFRRLMDLFDHTHGKIIILLLRLPYFVHVNLKV